MNPTTRRYLISSLITFLAVFFTTLGAQLTTAGHAEFSYASVLALILVAARAGVKAVIEALGGAVTTE